MRRKVNFIKATSVPFQEVGLKSMMICVRDLSGMGTKHDPLSVNYIVTGGECVTGKINASMTSEHARMAQMFSARPSVREIPSSIPGDTIFLFQHLSFLCSFNYL